MKRPAHIFFLFSLFFLLLSAPALAAGDVERLSLSSSSITVDENRGAILQAVPAVDRDLISVYWSVADESIARLSAAEGRVITVTGVSPGVTTVSARIGSGTPVSCSVTVSGIVIGPSALSLNREEAGTLSLSRYGNAANVSRWTWRSANTKAAKVEGQTGGALVTAVGSGGAVITCTGGAYRAVCTVTVSSWFSAPLVNGYLRQNDGRMSLSWWSSYSDEIASLLCGVYSAAGKLLSVQSVNTRAPADTGGVRSALIPWNGGEVESVKLFAVGADGLPLSPARTLEPPDEDADAPAFLSGYPAVLSNGFDSASDDLQRCLVRLSACASKDCVLYWALYRGGNGAPTAAAFRSGSLSGSLRHGEAVLEQNAPYTLELGGLSELTEYEVHFWLSNADFSAGSYISRVRFTTVDCTLPVFLSAPSVTTSRLNSVDLSCTVSENSIVYWAAIPSGTTFPRPPANGELTVKEIARHIIAGIGAASHSAATARANTPVVFQVDALQPQRSYDVWYVARDSAENDSVLLAADGSRAVITVQTLDNLPPTAEQSFTSAADDGTPYADTDIRIVFSEAVRRASTGETLTALYDAVSGAASDTAAAAAKEALAEALRNTIRLYTVSDTDAAFAAERTASNAGSVGDDWTIDYRNATAVLEDGCTVVTFPSVMYNGAAGQGSALNLRSGIRYRFRLSDLSDLSENFNPIAANSELPVFTTQSARAEMKALLLRAANYPDGVSYVDMAFSVTPSATARANPDESWDLLLWPDVSCSYEIYIRSRKAGSDDYSDDPWRKAANANGSGGTAYAMTPASGEAFGQSLYFDLYNLLEGELPPLTRLREDRVYEFAIRFLSLNGDGDRSHWDQEVHMRACVISGLFTELGNLSARITEDTFRAALTAGNVTDLSVPGDLAFRMTRTFMDMAVPEFRYGRPVFRPEDVTVEMNFQLNRPGTVYYLLAPVDSRIPTLDDGGDEVDWYRYEEVPASGEEDLFPLTAPLPPTIINPNYRLAGVVSGSASVETGALSVTAYGLLPESDYFAYLVLQGNGNAWSPQTLLYRFTTTETVPPALEASVENPAVLLTASRDVALHYAVASYENMGSLFRRPFWNNTPSGGQYAPSEFPAYANIETVLQAMAFPVDPLDGYGIGTVFDRYASETYRRSVADYIRAATAGSGFVAAAGEREIEAGQAVIIDASDAMAARTRYALLAVGRNDTAGEAFAAVWPLTAPDTTPPVVVSIENDLTADVLYGEATGTYSGSVTLIFDEYLYDKGSGSSPPILRQLDLGPQVSLWRSEYYQNFTGIGAMVQNSTSNTVWIADNDEAYVGRPTDSIVIQYSQAADGTFLVFKTDLCDADGNTRRVPLTVKIEASGGRPAVRITEEWDGRS